MPDKNTLSFWKATALLALLGLAHGSAWAAHPERSYTGIINYVDPATRTVDVQGAFFDRQFTLSPDCALLLPGHGPGNISELRPGENITLRYQSAAAAPVADRVRQNLMEYAGVVDDLDSTNRTVTVYSDRLDRTFNLAAKCLILLRNDHPGGLTNLQNGTHVVVTFETPGGAPTAQRIEQTSLVFTGKLKAVDPATGTLQARAGFHLRKFTVAKNCAILVHGRPVQLSDLRPDDKLVFSYDLIKGANVVSRIVPEGEATNIVQLDEYKIDL
jgi:hypothetical protein